MGKGAAQKQNILVAGAGKVGRVLAGVLCNSVNNLGVMLVDKDVSIAASNTIPAGVRLIECDISNVDALSELIDVHKIQAVVSCLPFFCNFDLAKIAYMHGCHYFDLTEDVGTTRRIFELSKNSEKAFVPQCGVAPGLVNIIANDFIKQCDGVADYVNLYCGALPQDASNAMNHAITWSTEGLVNEYLNPSEVIENAKLTVVPSLSGLERLVLNEQSFEAFHTSGGVGTLASTYEGSVNSMCYKTIRYPGHCEKIKLLLAELGSAADRSVLKGRFEDVMPTTRDDIVITHVCVEGIKENSPVQFVDTRCFSPSKLGNVMCSAIEMVTSVSAALIVDAVLSNPKRYAGPMKQEDFDFDELFDNPLAGYIKNSRCD